jgi:hypothetical protein
MHGLKAHRSPRTGSDGSAPTSTRDYTPWIDNDRRLRELLAQLEALGTAAFEADPRWKRWADRTDAGTARRATEAERQPRDRVGNACLTCGQPSDQPVSAQVNPKREDLTRWRLPDLGILGYSRVPRFVSASGCSTFAHQS